MNVRKLGVRLIKQSKEATIHTQCILPALTTHNSNSIAENFSHNFSTILILFSQVTNIYLDAREIPYTHFSLLIIISINFCFSISESVPQEFEMRINK
jgi:hypothetical protein